MTVTGSACGFFANVALFGGPPTVRGCGQTIPPGDKRSASPQVVLPAGGSATTLTESDNNGALAQFGPAILFGGKPPADPRKPTPLSGPMKVSTKGKRSVTSSASVKRFSAGPFVADSVRSTCSASKSGTKGSTTVTKGVLVIAADSEGNPTKTEAVPAQPPANFARTGVNSAGDSFKAVFNEQTLTEDGAITVVAFHLYLLGPVATGDVVVAEARAQVCAVRLQDAGAHLERALVVVHPGVVDAEVELPAPVRRERPFGADEERWSVLADPRNQGGVQFTAYDVGRELTCVPEAFQLSEAVRPVGPVGSMSTG